MAAVHYTKIKAGQEVTMGMIHCIRQTIDLAMEFVRIPTRFQGITLEGKRLSRRIANVEDAPESATTFLSSPDYLMSSLHRTDIDLEKIKETVEKLERETEELKHPTDRQSGPGTVHVNDFIWSAHIVKPNGNYTSTRIQLDTGSTASFVSQKLVNKASLVLLSDEKDEIFMTINNNPITVRQQVWVEWYAIDQAITRTTLCYVMPDLPVDMLVGSDHIIEYNLLAANRARSAFFLKSNILKKDPEYTEIENEARRQDRVAEERARTEWARAAQEAAQRRNQQLQIAPVPEDGPGSTVPTVPRESERTQSLQVQRHTRSDDCIATISEASPAATPGSSNQRPKIPRQVYSSPAGTRLRAPRRPPPPAGPAPNPATVSDSGRGVVEMLREKFSRFGPA